MGLQSSYRQVDGKIVNRSCEINVVEHCNLSCRGCSHLSPVAPKYFVDPAEVHASLSQLSRSYMAREARLVGGEPLLHPELGSVIDAVRTSGVAQRIVIVTNGLLLSRMPEAAWSAIDEVEISLYPGHDPKPDQWKRIEGLAQEHAVKLFPNGVARFRESYTEQRNEDAELVQQIFTSCKIAHQLRCHTVAHGYFFRCPQAYFLPKIMHERFAEPHVDGLRIEGTEAFGKRLLAYLTDPAPMKACSYCLGTAGALVQHVQIRRNEFRQAQDRPASSMISERQLHSTLAANGRASLAPFSSRARRFISRLRRVTPMPQ